MIILKTLVYIFCLALFFSILGYIWLQIYQTVVDFWKTLGLISGEKDGRKIKNCKDSDKK